jgi:hypothetical protein
MKLDSHVYRPVVKSSVLDLHVVGGCNGNTGPHMYSSLATGPHTARAQASMGTTVVLVSIVASARKLQKQTND